MPTRWGVWNRNELVGDTLMSSMFDAPHNTKWNVLNLGAGVQSSALALMAAKGEITPMPDFACFADTQAEPKSVYDWLEWLEGELPFPVYKVTKGNLTTASLTPKIRGKDGAGPKGSEYIPKLIPLFGLKPDGTMAAAIGRKCTSDYKIVPIQQKIKELCGIARGQKECTVTQWIGISWDEVQRMKMSRHPWTQMRWPLIEQQINREQCKEWMKLNGYPEPPRSACYYCPFHSDDEWRRLRNEDPDYFQKAIEFDKEIRDKYKNHDKIMQMEVYLHRKCKPLEDIDFDNEVDKGQGFFDFGNECEGMCGV